MKITKIEDLDKNKQIYQVTSEPDWFDRIFGEKREIAKYKFSFTNYKGEGVYIREDGEQFSGSSRISEALDKWRRRF